MDRNLQDIHDEVLEAYVDFRKKNIDLDAFRTLVDELDFLKKCNKACRSVLSKPSVHDAVTDLSPHSAMMTFLLRNFAAPRMVEMPHVDQDFPKEVIDLGLRLASLESIKVHADVVQDLVTFSADIFGQGMIVRPSPFAEGNLKFKWGFASYNAGKPYVFYLAQDIEPLLMIVNPNMGNIVGYYFPERDLVLGQNLNYAPIIANLRFEILRNLDLVRSYLLRSEPPTPTFLTGFMQHVGHTILNELTGLDCAIRDYPSASTMPILLGPYEFVETETLFPELADSSIVRLGEDNADLFSHCLKNHIFPFRPTMRHYLIKVEFRERFRAFAERVGHRPETKDPNLFQKVLRAISDRMSKTVNEGVGGRTPIVWIEVRSNHRIWVNQISGIKTLVDRMHVSHPNAALFIAGWSKPKKVTKEDQIQIDADMQIYSEIAAYAEGKLPVVCGVGLESDQKISWAYTADACVTTFGSGMTLPCLIANVPSVIHSNLHYSNQPAMHPDPQSRSNFAEALIDYEVIAPEHVIDEDQNQRFQVRNHLVDGDVVYDGLLNVLNRPV